MTTAQEILRLIEEVDPSDGMEMENINLHVYEYLEYHLCPIQSFPVPNYTRSRDALKAVRPNDFTFVVQEVFGQYESWDAVAKQYNSPVQLHAQGLETEELAELHAIIQAIDYERKIK